MLNPKHNPLPQNKTTMTRLRNIFIYLAATLTLSAAAQTTATTDTIVIPPLFEYPTVPDTITSWTNRSNWLATHFWDNFDAKSKSVGQIPLNHAFHTYIIPLQYSELPIAQKSIDNLLNRIQKNPGLLVQFAKAAQYNCYDVATAEQIIDDVYIPFVQALLKNKKVPKIHKSRFQAQLTPLLNTRIGEKIHPFPIIAPSGTESTFAHDGKYSLIMFADPTCVQCKTSRIQIENDSRLVPYIANEQLSLHYIVINPDELPESWQSYTSHYSDKWHKAASPDCDEVIDLRINPSIYILDKEGRLILKNSTLQHTLATLASLLSNDDAPKTNNIDNQ